MLNRRQAHVKPKSAGERDSRSWRAASLEFVVVVVVVLVVELLARQANGIDDDDEDDDEHENRQ